MNSAPKKKCVLNPHLCFCSVFGSVYSVVQKIRTDLRQLINLALELYNFKYPYIGKIFYRKIYTMIKTGFSRAILFATLFTFMFSFKALNKSGDKTTDNKALRWKNHVSSLFTELTGSKTGLKHEVFEKGLIGYYNLKNQTKVSDKNILSIVDFSISANQKRLWIINLSTKKILYNSLVAHGRNSGQAYAESFSNKPESYKSSLGFYITGNTYYGKHKLSLRLTGMDPSYNDNALSRAIVMHGAEYVSENWIRKNGRLGRSLGCPAIPLEISDEVINLLADGTCLFLYYPNKNYENESALLQKSFIIEMFDGFETKSTVRNNIKNTISHKQ